MCTTNFRGNGLKIQFSKGSKKHMFYENQPVKHQNEYKRMLAIIGNLTLLFSESDCPYLPYRIHENVFCKYFEAENLARMDCSADAKKDRIGVGLKTWVGQDDQKVAEFGKLRETFAGLTGIDLVKKIAEYRNERIRVTKNLNGIDKMIYHIVRRVPGAMEILEHSFEYIDINNLKIIKERGNVNNTYFTDGRHVYHFSVSKNTLYMIFDDMELLDRFEVPIMDDPYGMLMNLVERNGDATDVEDAVKTETPRKPSTKQPQICLRLYSTKANGEKFVAEHSGLNQWNGARLNSKTGEYKPRDPNELYIPYPAEDRTRTAGFFPGRDTIFELTLPDGKVIPAKICQDDGKAIMSNPNKLLGEWLLRNVFELPEGTLVTYEMLEKFGIDSVVFTKQGELKYSVDFSEVGTYEEFYEKSNLN